MYAHIEVFDCDWTVSGQVRCLPWRTKDGAVLLVLLFRELSRANGLCRESFSAEAKLVPQAKE